MNNQSRRSRPAQGSTRRTVVAALLAAPIVGSLARFAAARRAAIAASRPAADGRSGQRCALCGSEAHSMLGCPDTPKVV